MELYDDCVSVCVTVGMCLCVFYAWFTQDSEVVQNWAFFLLASLLTYSGVHTRCNAPWSSAAGARSEASVLTSGLFLAWAASESRSTGNHTKKHETIWSIFKIKEIFKIKYHNFANVIIFVHLNRLERWKQHKQRKLTVGWEGGLNVTWCQRMDSWDWTGTWICGVGGRHSNHSA